MRKVELRMNELQKYDIIKSLVHNDGNKKRAAVKLDCSLRTINRLINIYKVKGKTGFIHGNRSKQPSIALSQNFKEGLVKLYKQYPEPNFNHFKDLIWENHKIKVSYCSLYSILTKANILSPKAFRKTRKAYANRLAKKIENREKLEPLEQELIVETNILEPHCAHSRIPRSKYAGELIQMDASHHPWFGDEKAHLHAAIDNATNTVVGLYFDYQETLNGYYHVLRQTILNYGIPFELLTDRRTVFEYKQKKNPSPENDTMTQFGFACEQLGIRLSTTSVAQRKGRIERLFETLQSRLTVELKYHQIHNIQDANRFLTTYIDKHNRYFSLNNHNITHVYEKLNEKDNLNLILARVVKRTFTGGCIRYKNKYFQPYDESGDLINFKPKTKTLLIETFSGDLFINNQGKYYKLYELPKHKFASENFDYIKVDKEKQREKKKYTPTMDHPWKRKSYEAYLRKQGSNFHTNV